MLANHKISFFAVVILAATLFVSSPANASHTDNTIDVSNWDVTILDRPFTYRNISAGAGTVQVMRLTTDSGTPINKSQLSGQAEFTYNGSAFQEPVLGALTHMRDGYWYTTFNGHSSSAGTLLMQAQGETRSSLLADSQDKPANATRSFNLNGMNLDLEPSINSTYRAGKDVSLAVDLTNRTSGSTVSNADVNVYFTNISWTSAHYTLGFNPDTNRYTNTVSLPRQPNSTYIIHVNASTGSGVNASQQGAESFVFNTYPSIDGQIEYVNGSSSRCDAVSMPTVCEPDADVTTAFNITSSSAQNVNITLMGRNSTGLQRIQEATVNKNGNIYTSTFTVPEFNTSKYGTELVLRYHAVNGERKVTKFYNMTKAGFYLNDKSGLTAYQGSEFQVRTFIGRPQSLRSYPQDLLKNGSTVIRRPDGSQLTNFSLENMSYDASNDLWTKTVDIPVDAPNGSYTIESRAYNVFNRMEELDPAAGFRVRSITQTFTSPMEVGFNINSTGIVHRNITLENKINSPLEVNTTVQGDFVNYTTIVDGDNITIPGNGNVTATMAFNITEFNDHDGQVTFFDEGSPYNSTTNVSLDMIECGTMAGNFCLGQSSEWYNVSTDERGTSQHSLDMYNIGPSGSNVNVSVNVSGDIAEFISLESNELSFMDSADFNFNLTSTEPTDVNGTLEFIGESSSITLNTRYLVNVTVLESGMNVRTSSIDLGVLPEGESGSGQVTVENTGNLEILRWFATSSDYNVTLEGKESLPAGETLNMTVIVDDISSNSGQMELEGQTGDRNLTSSISISVDTIPPFSQMESEIEQRRSSLEQEASGEALNMLSDITIKLSNLETNMQNENYEAAQTKYQDIQDTLDEVQTMINEQESQDPGNNQNNTGTEPEPTPPGGNDPTPPGGSESGGGLPILPIAIVVFLLLVIGFVFYTSYIPEPGDPLYDLLGEQ